MVKEIKFFFSPVSDFSNAAGSHPAESSLISGLEEPEEKEDFEFISEDELAEASEAQKWFADSSSKKEKLFR